VLTDYNVSPSATDSAVYAVCPSARHLSSMERVLIDFLAERFHGNRYFQ